MKLNVKIMFSLLLLSSLFGLSQKGNYFIHNYLPAQYNASDQNRCILQDIYGRVFVANNDGLLINNGAEWDKIQLPFICLSLGKDENDEIFVAGDGDFGKLVIAKNGSFKFKSLKNVLPKENQSDLGKFWTIINLKKHIYFCSNQTILDYDYKTIKTILPGEEGFHTFFKVDNHFILREKGKGLKILSYNNEFMFLKGGEQFADNNNPVRGIIKGDSCHFIITPHSVYAFNFNKTLPELSTIKKIETPINNWLNEKTVYCTSNIGENNFAFGSVKGGVLITDKNFNVVKHINSNTDLQDDGVNYIYNDNQGHIWLALAKGISLIEFNSPITKFTKSDGIIGTTEACTFYNGISYLATDKGILKYNSSASKFEPTNITEASWCLAQANGKLLAGTKSGLYFLEKNEFNLLYEAPSAVHYIFTHPKQNNLIYIGTETGYSKGILNGDKLEIKKEIEMVADIRTIAMSENGTVYFGTLLTGIFAETDTAKPLLQLTEKDGLPGMEECYLFNHKGAVLIATDNGVYSITGNDNHLKVSADIRFNNLNNNYIISRAITIGEDIWLTAKLKKDPRATEMLWCLENKNGKFEIKNTQLSRIKESDTKSFCFTESLVYIGTNNGLYCYDLGLKTPRFGLNTFINTFSVGSDSSQLFFNIHPRSVLSEIKLNYHNNSIEIRLGASDYLDKSELLFAYYLKGRDTSYSSYSSNKIIRFDHLYEGDYVFYVKSKNILGIEGQEIKITFSILPPWYRTIWAYCIYVFLILVLVYFIIKLNSKRLIEQNLRLEKIITERTKEINKQKLEIEHKNQEITDSINYAKGIQDSILPSINEIKKVWSDLFIFFQPKDIVSGDFYWFKQINKDEFLIAGADCTGHGVPGGFMSMICSDKLHDAARETTMPNEILFKANNSIKESLRQQNEGKSKDGMEICLLKVNLKTREVLFAGANRHLWVIDNKTKTLKEIKPTKASIASFTEFNFKYDLNTLQLNKGDILFLSTDGYPDQFGGAHGKKYMSKNFKNFIVGNAHLSITEQEKEITSNINTWMNGYEQVDDLLVIGIKL
ncbi:MAG: SpoIIE family protein phosphatase [Sphingobacteriaceae bacterium]|nr:SpoIIE family protein phosphatase [Sphingobacteriaceae bacterium]